MKYPAYLEALEAILQTGRVNKPLEDVKKQKIYPELEAKLTAAGGVNEKGENSIKAAILALYDLCAGSPLLTTNDTGPVLSPLFQQSQDALNLEQLPLVLSGPLVRRAMPEAVTVWIALKTAATVSLTVFEDQDGSRGAAVLSGQAPTVALGAHLHVAAVTAVPTPAGALSLAYGQSYLYELNFGNEQTLTSLDLAAALAYPGYSGPAFMLPPQNLNRLHLIHGSCRNISSGSYDALPALDGLLASEWKGQRPQQLFLSGDQIYADEANEPLEHLYISVGNTLLSGPAADGRFAGAEKMRRQEDGPADVVPADIIPGERGHLNKIKEFKINNQYRSLVDLLRDPAQLPDYPPRYPGQNDRDDYIHDLCGFTPTSRFHLLSLADFCGMYLLSWSEVLWPALYREEAVKKWAQQHSMAHKNDAAGNVPARLEKAMGQLTALEKELIGKLNNPGETRKKACVEAAYEVRHFRMVLRNVLEMLHMALFAADLVKVRRVLANIATYMMFDDHEVTDDWHMTREWVHRVYSKPMGRRVLQNGLAAYAVFQAWGNTPERFAAGQPGGKLLAALTTWIASQYTDPASEQVIANALKIPDKTQVAKYRAIGPGDTFPELYLEPLTWDYQVNHPRYEVLVIDTRTFRRFPGSLYGGSEHMTGAAVTRQLPAPAGGQPRELTIVISPCNVVTIPLFRNYLSQVALPLAQYFANYKGNRWEMTAYDPDQADSWEAGTRLFETFLGRLALRTAAQPPAAKTESRVIILSGDVHFSYAGRLAYWADKPFEAQQAQTHEMVLAHLTSSGIKNEANAWRRLKLDLLGYEFTDLGSTATRLPEPEVLIGYAQAPAALDQAKKDEIVLRTRWFPSYKPAVLRQQPLLLPSLKIHPDVKVPKPEWMYRMDFIRGTKEKNVENINTISHFHFARDQGPSSEIIRRSNVATLTLDWEGEGKLAQALPAAADAFAVQVTVGKAFPRPPFYVIVDTEILYVPATEAPASEAEVRFKQVKRGRADTESKDHAAGAVVRLRRAVTQVNWLVAEVPLAPKDSPPGNGTAAPTAQPLTRFKVPLALDDLQYAKPTLNTL